MVAGPPTSYVFRSMSGSVGRREGRLAIQPRLGPVDCLRDPDPIYRQLSRLWLSRPADAPPARLRAYLPIGVRVSVTPQARL